MQKINYLYGIVLGCSLGIMPCFRDSIFDNQGIPTLFIMQVAAWWSQGLKSSLHDDIVKAQDQRHALITMTQKEWLRQEGKERWEISELPIDDSIKEKLLVSFANLGCCHEVQPTKKHYKGVILYGGTLSRVCIRLAYLMRLWSEGVRWDEIVLLGSRRPLNPEIEPCDAAILHESNLLALDKHQLAPELPTDEAAMMQWLVNGADFPKDLRAVPVRVIAPAMKIMTDGTIGRPTTADTIKDWLTTYKPEGDYLAISNQPFIGYQDAVGRFYMSPSVQIESVGPAVHQDKNSGFFGTMTTKVSEYLDTIARWAWQENKIIERDTAAK